MGGGLMQLVAYGAQDIYLTGNPQITFFKVVYRRHTNFSMETIEQTINGTSVLTTSTTNGTITISRNGDLVHRVYVTSSSTGVTHGDEIISEVELEIGGQKIDKHTARWLQVYADLTEPNSSGISPAILGPGQDKGTPYQNMAMTGYGTASITFAAPSKAFIPLRFWFCRNPGLALPLIALQYHEVKVKITFNTETFLLATAGGGDTEFKLWADYIYLDTDERRRFAQVSHEYLIEQVQIQSDSVTIDTSKDIELNFNHPVKELIWIFTNSTKLSAAAGEADTQEAGYNAVTAGSFQLGLNGHDRFAARDYKYFSRVQVWQHHTGHGGLGDGTGGTVNNSNDGILVYSFALKPEEHQPSGTCNFSRIDNAQLKMTTPGGTAGMDGIEIFAVNYNVLRIMSGMGGLAYSN